MAKRSVRVGKKKMRLQARRRGKKRLKSSSVLRKNSRRNYRNRRKERVSTKKRKRSSSSRTRRSHGTSSSAMKVRVNRAPLLMLWVAIVAQREGYRYLEGVTFGKAVAAICGHARGKAIGKYKGGKPSPRGAKKPRERKFKVFGMKIPGKIVNGRVHACKSGMEISPKGIQEYLKRAFGCNLKKVKVALRKLASKYSRHEIGKRGYYLYEKFRPSVPGGLKGWGAKGVLDLTKVRKLARK